MTLYEIITNGIPECSGFSYGLFQNEDEALKEFEEIDKRLQREDLCYGYDYGLKIVKREAGEKMKLFLCILIILFWLPFSIPLILLGSICRLTYSSVVYGYEATDAALKYLRKGAFSKREEK